MCAIGLLMRRLPTSAFPVLRTPGILHSVGMEGSILVHGTMLPSRLSAGAIKSEASGMLDVLFQSILIASAREDHCDV